MDTYLIANIFMLSLLLLVLGIRRVSKVQMLTLLGLLILTAIFDSLIVATSIVGYDPSKILGIFVGYAPIEDFFYPVAASLVIPTIWQWLRKG